MNSRKKNTGRDGARRSNNGDKNGGAKGGRPGGRRRKGPKRKKVDPKVFWGDPQALPTDENATAAMTTDPSAVIRSLGRPPLSGQQNAAEHYFTAVYDRAVNLAAALAAAGDMIEAEDLTGEHH